MNINKTYGLPYSTKIVYFYKFSVALAAKNVPMSKLIMFIKQLGTILVNFTLKTTLPPEVTQMVYVLTDQLALGF